MKRWPEKPKRALWTGIRSGIKPHGWTSKPTVKQRLKPRSRSYTSRMRRYRKQVSLFLNRNPFCAVFPGQRSTECHHKKGRGKYLLDESTWLAVSRAAHIKIHSEPAWAYKNGYLEKRN